MLKKAIVTGYSSGIGKEIASHLENNGYEIIKLKSISVGFKHLESSQTIK